MRMRSGSYCSKGTLSASRIILLFAVSFALTCMNGCGAIPETGKTTIQESGTETEASVVTSDTTEEKSDPVNKDYVPEAKVPDNETKTENGVMKQLKMEINGTEVTVSWEGNESVAALMELAEQAPITVHMSMYGGFELVGPLGTSLPRNDKQTTTSAGDIVLYSGHQIVVFYGTNSWSYTRLGHVELNAAEMSDLLSHGDVTITLSVE